MSINQVQNKQSAQVKGSGVNTSGKCHKRRSGQSGAPSAFAQKLKARQDSSAKAGAAVLAGEKQAGAPIKDGPATSQVPQQVQQHIPQQAPQQTPSQLIGHERAHHLTTDAQALVPHELMHTQGLGQLSDREQRHEQAHTEHVERLDSSHVEVEQRTTHQQTQRAEQTQATDRQVIQTLVEQIVKSCHVGQNARKQRVLLMHVEIPGQGKVHIKLERQRQGTRLRFRAANASLAQKIKSNAPALHENLRARGVDVTRVEVSTRTIID